jgi:hypothetical protein
MFCPRVIQLLNPGLIAFAETIGTPFLDNVMLQLMFHALGVYIDGSGIFGLFISDGDKIRASPIPPTSSAEQFRNVGKEHCRVRCCA